MSSEKSGTGSGKGRRIGALRRLFRFPYLSSARFGAANDDPKSVMNLDLVLTLLSEGDRGDASSAAAAEEILRMQATIRTMEKEASVSRKRADALSAENAILKERMDWKATG